MTQSKIFQPKDPNTMSNVLPIGMPAALHDVIRHRKLLNVNPEMAGRILAELPYAGQRKLDEMHAYALAETMERGLFLPDTQIAFGRLGGGLFLVNGRHRMHAVGLARTAVVFEVAVYDCADAHELDDLYCRFDTLQRPRSAAQIVDAMGVAEDGGLSTAMARILYSAAPFLMTGFERLANSQRPAVTKVVTERMKVVEAYRKAAVDYQDCLEHPGPRYPGNRFRSAGVAAVAFATLHAQPAKAVPFWAGAIADDGLAALDPRKALANDLRSRPGTGGGSFPLIEAAATAWNAFYRGRELSYVRVVGKGPIRILGTPYAGR